MQSIETIPVMSLSLQDANQLVKELEAYHAIYSPLFRRREQREWSSLYLQGLLSELPRKSVEPMVIALRGSQSSVIRAMQQFLGEGSWEDETILKRHWVEVEATLGETDGVLMLDGSDFAKQGHDSVGVQRQYCGELGKRANCQAGVFLGYASRKGYTLLDRRLYLPEAWVNGAEFAQRRKKCGVPQDISFKTKQQLAWEMIQVQQSSGVLRYRWLVCDEGFGRDTKLLDQIDRSGIWYFAEVPHDTCLWGVRPQTHIPPYCGRGRKATREHLLDGQPSPRTVLEWASNLAPEAWSPHTIKEGSKGPIIADFACLRLVAVRQGLPGPEVWLVLRRTPDGELKTYLSNAPVETSEQTLIRLSGMRWPIETCFEQSKQYLGMGDYEVRSWRGWHHHMTLCILSHHFLVRLQSKLKKKCPC
jgi:SRSO17 transposase